MLDDYAMDVGTAISIGAAAFAGASTFFAWLALRQARKANELPTLLDYLREYRKIEPERRYVIRDLHREHVLSLGVAALPAEARAQVLAVCHYLDQLGMLVNQGFVTSEVVAGFMGESILRIWKSLEPYIAAERAARAGDYADYFEDLVTKVLTADPRALRKHLRHVPPEAEFPRVLSDARAETEPRHPSPIPPPDRKSVP